MREGRGEGLNHWVPRRRRVTEVTGRSGGREAEDQMGETSLGGRTGLASLPLACDAEDAAAGEGREGCSNLIDVELMG